MKNDKTLIIVMIIVAAIILIFLFVGNKKQKKRSDKEYDIILQALALKQQRESIESQDTASIGDWLGFGTSTADAVAAIFSGVDMGASNIGGKD